MTEQLTEVRVAAMLEHLLILVLASIGAGFLLNRILWWVFG